MRRQSVTKLRIRSESRKKNKDYKKSPHEWRTYLIHKSRGFASPDYRRRSEKIERYKRTLEAQKTEYTPFISSDFVFKYLKNSDFVKNQKEREYIKYYIDNGPVGIGVIGCSFYEVQERKLRKWIMKENMKRRKKGRPALRLQDLILMR